MHIQLYQAIIPISRMAGSEFLPGVSSGAPFFAIAIFSFAFCDQFVPCWASLWRLLLRLVEVVACALCCVDDCQRYHRGGENGQQLICLAYTNLCFVSSTVPEMSSVTLFAIHTAS